MRIRSNRRRTTHVPVGNIFVPIHSTTGAKSKSNHSKNGIKNLLKKIKSQKNNKTSVEDEQIDVLNITDSNIQERKTKYFFEREKVIPEVRQFMEQLLSQNSNLENYLGQLLEILEMLNYKLPCNDFITMHSSVRNTENLDYINFTALERFLDNNGKNMPLFSIDALANTVTGEILSVRVKCAKAVDKKEYSFELSDGVSLEINQANENLTNIFYRNTISGEIINTIEVYKNKEKNT